MKDLFEKQGGKLRGKMLELARDIRELYKDDPRGVLSSDVVKWGTENYYVSALRASCLLAERGYLRRLTEEEVLHNYGHQLGQGVWIPTGLLMQADLR